MNLQVRKVTITGKDRKNVKKIYTDAFEKKERMPFWMMLLMAKLWNTDFLSFYDGNQLCGLIYLAKSPKLVFVMFLAVDENMRSHGYGSSILEKLRFMYPNKKIISTIERTDVEAKDLENRLRRKKFYFANGYGETGYLIELAKIKQEIIIINGQFSKRELFWFFVLYSNGVMHPKIWEK